MAMSKATAEGIAAADAGANEKWKIAAYETVVEVAAEQPEFTSDDVMRLLSRKKVETRNLRAFGPVMIKARKNGIAEKTGRSVNSERESQHNCPIQVWKSLLY